MRIGIASPIVTFFPGAHSEWETSASITELARVAVEADRLGYDHLTCSEHVAVPEDIAEQRGATYWDPLATFGYLAACTDRIRLATQVLVLGYHHPLEIAKRYGTLDHISNGRLVLGLGVGSLEQEFELLGAEFSGRGARADEAMRALRASLSVRMPEFHGDHFDYSGFVIEPHASQERVPMWVGGRTLRSLRRATTYGDGWAPFGLSPQQLAELLGQLELPSGFDVVLNPGRQLDPIGEPEVTALALSELRHTGATIASVALAARSAGHYCEQLAALAEVFEVGCAE